MTQGLEVTKKAQTGLLLYVALLALVLITCIFKPVLPNQLLEISGEFRASIGMPAPTLHPVTTGWFIAAMLTNIISIFYGILKIKENDRLKELLPVVGVLGIMFGWNLLSILFVGFEHQMMEVYTTLAMFLVYVLADFIGIWTKSSQRDDFVYALKAVDGPALVAAFLFFVYAFGYSPPPEFIAGTSAGSLIFANFAYVGVLMK
jgi:hypothetical protein